MGLGYYGSSSSSSSSNLSPLAPPFTVDRSNHNKPVVISNPVSHFNDPSYAVPITSSLPYSHSTGAGQEFYGDSSRNTNDYGLIIHDAVVDSHNWGGLSSNGLGQMTQASSHWSAVNPSSKPVAEPPFYHPYGSSVKDDDVPLVSFSETGCDLFSTSGFVHSDENDYTRNLSGLEYNPNLNPKQEGVWSRLSLPEEKPVEKTEKDDSFFLKEANTSASFAYNSCLNQGAYGTETLSKGNNDPSMLYYADIIRRANNNGKSDGTSFSANNHSLDYFGFPVEESHFRPFSKYHPSLIQSTTKSSPLVIKSPAGAVSAFSASSQTLEIGNAAGGQNISDATVGCSHKFSKEKDETPLPQLSFQMGTTDAAPFSVKDTKLSSASDQLNFEFKAKPSFLQVPDINIPDAANSFDHHNPAEDSPCWKGSPFLPFESPETQPSTKKLQRGTNIQGTDYSYNNHSSDGKTSSTSIPFHTDMSKVVDSLKVRDGVADAIKPNKGHAYDANSQTSKLNLPNPEEHAILLAQMYGGGADKNVNASILVKALYNLSDLLLRACSNEVLKENDREALDHVTRNLGVCMSRQVQVSAASTNNLILPHPKISLESQLMNETSGTFQDGEQHAHYLKMKSDVFGESVKNLLEHASLKDLDPPKGDNMVQAIKKVLDENLESEMDLPSETTLLYKNLWLEAEAELCSLSYRARFERLKRETQKEKPHKSTAKGDASAIKESLKSCNGSTFLKADDIKVSNAQHVDDVINVHGEQNPVKEGHAAGVKVTGPGVTLQHQPCKDDIGDHVSQLMARWNIIKHREESNSADLVEEGAFGEERDRFQDQEEAATTGSGSDWEHILKDEFSWRLS